MKNHLGKYECKLCLTLHNNEGSYLAHTQGKRHQDNLYDVRALRPCPLSCSSFGPFSFNTDGNAPPAKPQTTPHCLHQCVDDKN